MTTILQTSTPPRREPVGLHAQPDAPYAWHSHSRALPLEDAYGMAREHAAKDGAREDRLVREGEPARAVRLANGRVGLRLATDEQLPLRMTAIGQLARGHVRDYRAWSERGERAQLRILDVALRERTRPLRLRLAGGEIRAVLSARYAACDDATLFGFVDDALESQGLAGEALVRDVALGTRTLLRVTFPGEARSVLPGDVIEHGFDLLNSEVGLASLSVTPITYRLLCTNGARGWYEEDHARIRHVGDPDRVRSTVREAVIAAIGDAPRQLDAMARATHIQVPSARRAFDELAKDAHAGPLMHHARRALASEWNLPSGSEDAVSESLERPASVYDIVNAITAAARRMRFTTSRLRAESVAQRYLTRMAA